MLALALLAPAFAGSPCARLPGDGPDDFGEGPSQRAECRTARILGMGGAGLTVAGAAVGAVGVALNEADPSGNVAWPMILAGGGAVAVGTPLVIAGAASMAEVTREHGHPAPKWASAVAWACYGASAAGLALAIPTEGATLPLALVQFGGAVGFGAAQWAISSAAWRGEADARILAVPTGNGLVVAATF